MIMNELHNAQLRFHFFSAPNLEHVLAVANEEGFVRLYDAEAQTPSKHIFKGECCTECDLRLVWETPVLLQPRKAFCKSFKRKCGQYLNPFVSFAGLLYKAAAGVCSYNSSSR